MVTLAEMLIYRLMVPALRPRDDLAPPAWHAGLTYVGLFLFYFASALAIGVIAHQLWQLFRIKTKTLWGRWVLLPVGGVFVVLAILSILTRPSAGVTFLLEASFVFAVLILVASLLFRKGDLGIKIGMVLLAAPLVVHFYAPFSVRYIGGEEALWNGLTDQVEAAGRWIVLLAALALPYCMGARPFFLRAARLLPLMASLFVGVFGALLVRKDYLKAMDLAQNGLGISIGPAAPSSLIALCLLALSAVAWTLANTLTAPSESRRSIGVGIALIMLGGYAFAWPLQYLAGLAGFITIVKASFFVQVEESVKIMPTVPAIADEEWNSYMDSALQILRKNNSESTGLGKGAVVNLSGDGDACRTHFVYSANGASVRVTVERLGGVIVGLDVRIGEGEAEGEPCWALHNRRASKMGLVHPSPPVCNAAPLLLEPSEFSARFRVVDKEGWTTDLLNERLRAEIQKRVRGWVAIWPDGTLRFQVYPGRGAPLDSPIPVTGLAFQTGPRDPDDLIELLETLGSLAKLAESCVENS